MLFVGMFTAEHVDVVFGVERQFVAGADFAGLYRDVAVLLGTEGTDAGVTAGSDG